MRDETARNNTTVREALNAALCIHGIAWTGIAEDGKTLRYGCFCGWEGFDIYTHCQECAEDE